MYFGVSNGRYKSSQLPGWGWGPLPSPLTALSKMPPELSIYGLFLLGKVQGGWGGGAEGWGVKKQLPKNPLHTVALQREKLPLPPNLSSAATFVSFEGGRMKRGEKKNALGERWGSDKGRHKKGVGIAFKFRGPTGLQRAIPSGAGTRARFQSSSEPKLRQPRDGGPSESPVSSARLGAPAGL